MEAKNEKKKIALDFMSFVIKVARVVSQFRHLCIDQFGGLDAVWTLHTNPKCENHISNWCHIVSYQNTLTHTYTHMHTNKSKQTTRRAEWVLFTFSMKWFYGQLDGIKCFIHFINFPLNVFMQNGIELVLISLAFSS